MSLSQVSLAEFRQALLPEALRTMRILHLALAGGIALFTVVLLFLYATGTSGGQGDGELVGILSVFVALAFPASFIVGKIVADRQLAGGRTGGQPPDETSASRCVSLIRTATLLRAALIEGATYFALAVLTLAITDGLVYTQPVYLANFFYPFLALAYFVSTFPTQERIEALFVGKIVGMG